MSISVEADLDEKFILELSKMWKVIFLNDDFTGFEFVVEVLKTEFNKEESEAWKLARTIHSEGYGVAGIYSFEVAETKATRVMRKARAMNFPLKLEVELDE